MWLKWLPWRFILSRVARSQGFIDPVAVIARLHRFAQPSEVAEPIELLRAGMVFHARGLINARAIQHNLHWVWPYWIERQFDPADCAFLPRAFSITHVNLTNRNWTAVGLPDCEALPIVDPRGLVTPLADGWSVDAWVVPHEGAPLFPCRASRACQRLVLNETLAIETNCQGNGSAIQNVTDLHWVQGGAQCRMRLRAQAPVAAWLAVSLRPANPEGISFIHRIDRLQGRASFLVNDQARMEMSPEPAHTCMSRYRHGDIAHQIGAAEETASIECEVGLATAAALFPIRPGQPTLVTVSVPLSAEGALETDGSVAVAPASRRAKTRWPDAIHGCCTLRVPDRHMTFLFDASLRTLVLHSPHDVYPGPYTYRRFWFRDAAFVIHALLAVGLAHRAKRAIERFPLRQTRLGYFHSQNGEWDSNGEALWIIDRYRRLTGERPCRELLEAVIKGAHWIQRKRLKEAQDVPHAGLLPPGFSAEHLGPNDYYYWDDFWAVAGLRAAAALLRNDGNDRLAERWAGEATRLLRAIDRSIERSPPARQRGGVPASPYRDMDSGAVGSLVAGYPLQLWAPRDTRLLATVEFLLRHCMVKGGFFQDIIHSGINPYLTLHLAQVLLRAGDARCHDLTHSVAALASPTGQWPEAIHPHTAGGCMGDGQHVWAAAEWILLMRNGFVREEGPVIVLGSGLPQTWIDQAEPLGLGPTPTAYGPISVEFLPERKGMLVSWEGNWRGGAPRMNVRVAGYESVTAEADAASVFIRKQAHAPSVPERET